MINPWLIPKMMKFYRSIDNVLEETMEKIKNEDDVKKDLFLSEEDSVVETASEKTNDKFGVADGIESVFSTHNLVKELLLCAVLIPLTLAGCWLFWFPIFKVAETYGMLVGIIVFLSIGFVAKIINTVCDKKELKEVENNDVN